MDGPINNGLFLSISSLFFSSSPPLRLSLPLCRASLSFHVLQSHHRLTGSHSHSPIAMSQLLLALILATRHCLVSLIEHSGNRYPSPSQTWPRLVNFQSRLLASRQLFTHPTQNPWVLCALFWARPMCVCLHLPCMQSHAV